MDMKKEEFLVKAFTTLQVSENKVEDVSDGYHTYKELYHHRAVLFSVICNVFNKIAWKSKLHHDGTMFDNMFIVGIDTPSGQATYHYDINPYWDMFAVKELKRAPEWDGHTPDEAINRILKLPNEYYLTKSKPSGTTYSTTDIETRKQI